MVFLWYWAHTRSWYDLKHTLPHTSPLCLHESLLWKCWYACSAQRLKLRRQKELNMDRRHIHTPIHTPLHAWSEHVSCTRSASCVFFTFSLAANHNTHSNKRKQSLHTDVTWSIANQTVILLCVDVMSSSNAGFNVSHFQYLQQSNWNATMKLGFDWHKSSVLCINERYPCYGRDFHWWMWVAWLCQPHKLCANRENWRRNGNNTYSCLSYRVDRLGLRKGGTPHGELRPNGCREVMILSSNRWSLVLEDEPAKLKLAVKLAEQNHLALF